MSILLGGQIAGHILYLDRYTGIQRSGLENGLWKCGANAYPLVFKDSHNCTVEGGYFETATLYSPQSAKTFTIATSPTERWCSEDGELVILPV